MMRLTCLAHLARKGKKRRGRDTSVLILIVAGFSSRLTRYSGQIRLLPVVHQGRSIVARQGDMRGVVVSQARRYAW